MSAQDNAAAVQRLYAAFGSGDIPTVLDHLDDDVAWESWTVDHKGQAAGIPWQAERRGKEGAAAFFELVSERLEIHDFQVLDVLPGERQVAAEVVIEFTDSETGARLRDEELHLWTFGDDGKVTRVRHYTDTAKHAAAAGVAVPA
jgi:ketosteroid isomerase-like protein